MKIIKDFIYKIKVYFTILLASIYINKYRSFCNKDNPTTAKERRFLKKLYLKMYWIWELEPHIVLKELPKDMFQKFMNTMWQARDRSFVKLEHSEGKLIMRV